VKGAAAVPGRLVHVTTTAMSLELLLGAQLEAFAGAGYEVIGVSAPDRFVADLRARGIRHAPLRHATRAMAPHRDAAALGELVRVLRTLRPEIVHTHNPKPGVYGRIAARLVGVPVVVNTCHGLYALPGDPWPKRAVVYGLERVAAACSDAELVQNPEDLATLRRLRVPARALHLLGNGVDLSRFRPGRLDPSARAALRAELGAGPDDVLCGVVGRLVWEKGHAEVFTAARLLSGRAPQVRWVVIGPHEPDKPDAVDAVALERAETDAPLRHVGERRDLELCYAAMDLFVLASHREGFPRAAMEAAASGLPIIATAIRGCRQVVDDGHTGLLVPARDAEALADAVASLAADPDRRRAMGAAAAAKARREFDQDRVIAETLATYARLREARGARRPAGSGAR
jgi:glycosyltransferase involved in cell wall biosynthesis